MPDPRHVGVVLGTIRLPLSDTSPKAARDLAASIARSWELDEGVEYRTKLATSELATNAVRYGKGMDGSTVLVVITRTGQRLRGEVHDASAVMPMRGTPGVDDVTGRGLIIVDDIVTECGCYPTPFGKAAWFEIEAKWPLDLAATA